MTRRLIALALWAAATLAALLSIAAGLVAALGWPGARYARNLLVAHDQAANAALGGDPDETISSRCAKRAAACCRPCRILCRLLARLDHQHCQRSLETDEGRDAVID